MYIDFSKLFLISNQMFKIVFQAVLQFSIIFLFPIAVIFLWVRCTVHNDSICVAAIFLVFSVVY